MGCSVCDPANLNPLPESEDSSLNLLAIYDVSRGRLFSIPQSRVGTGGSGGTGNTFTGSGVPDVGLGVDGDYYIDAPTGDGYGPKTAGAWGGVSFSIAGEDGLGTKQDVAISSGVLTIDYAAGRVIYVPLGANITDINFTNWPATGTFGKVSIRFTADGTPRTIAFSSIAATVKAEGGVAPVVPSGNGDVLWVHITSADALTTADLFIGASKLSAI